MGAHQVAWYAAFTSDTVAVIAVLGIAFLALLSCLLVRIKERQIWRALGSFEETVQTWLTAWPAPRAKDSLGLSRDVEDVILFHTSDRRIVVAESPEQRFRARVQRETRAKLVGWLLDALGDHLTAWALVVTFVLLGWVLVNPIYKALSSSDSAALAMGLQQMGAKFFVSAIGLLGSAVFGVYSRRSLETLQDKVSGLARELLRGRLTLLTQYHAQVAEASAEHLKKLESLDVTVQGIGQEVIQHAGTMMKAHIGEVISDAITKIHATVTEVAADLQQRLSQSFEVSLSQQVSQLQGGLRSVQGAIEGQAQGNLERLLEQLGDVVSGGFKSQSSDMGRQLAQLADVLPKLERQFSTMSETLGQSAQSWGEQNARAVDELSGRISQLLGQFDGVGQRIDLAIQGFSSAAAHQAQESGQQMSAFRRAAQEDGANLEQRTKGFADAVSRSQVEIVAVNRTIRDTTEQLQRILQAVGTTNQRTEATLQTLDAAARQLVNGAQGLERSFAKQSETVVKEERLLVAQREAVSMVETMLGGALKAYERSVAEQSSKLAEGWKRLAGEVKEVVDQAGSSLTSSVNDLSDSVNDLKTALKPNERPRS